MKKILIACFFLIIPLFASGQLSGDGSSGNPFYGTISNNVQWSAGNPNYGSTVYVGTAGSQDITITTGGHLTIDPGIKVIFTQLTSDLVITGSGVLTSNGTAADSIVFTKDAGISHWGHITFETPGSTTPITGTGSFAYCRIDYGYTAGTFPNPNSAGGAIQVNAPNVTINNCTFKNNNARFGGAVTVNAGQNTVVRNCMFKSNDAIECAGALLLHLSSTATVENCIFDDNYCAGSTQSYYGGGAIWIRQSTSKIVNCTFVKNSSPRAGDAIYAYQSSGARIINSILWGSNDQTATNSTGPVYSNCAFETTAPPTAVNSITLNSVNTAIDGPNFVTTDGSDWSVSFISPCRDAGANSYTGVTIPSSDFAGKPTIYNKDMGAFELQYSRWTGATNDSWTTASNWVQNVDPSSGSGDVIIPSGVSIYPVNSLNPSFTISSGKQMMIEPGARVTLSNMTNNGLLRLGHDANDFASLILDSYSRGAGGSEEIKLFLTGGGSDLLEDYKWHYISSPVSSLSTGIFTGVTLDLAQFVESRPTTSLLQGWVAFDGYVYSTGQTNGPTFNTLTAGKGYNFWDGSDNTFTFGGLFNTSNTVIPIGYSGIAGYSGFNLLGNPFPSGLNWDDITNGVYFAYPASTSKGLYFTRNNQQCSYINGVGIPSDVTGIIPPMQGFFVKTSGTGNSITLPSSARTHNNIHARYKGSAGTIPLIRLSIAETTTPLDEAVVRFDMDAKTALDDDFDAIKMFLSSSKTTIHTVLSGTDFAINGLPYPEDGQVTEIPVVVNVTTTGNHIISVTQLQGLDTYDVTLTDKLTGFVADLKTEPQLNFTAPAGNIHDRFVLKVGNIATVAEDPFASAGSFRIYQGYGYINILPLNSDWEGKLSSVRIFDITGKTVSMGKGIEIRTNTLTQIQEPGRKGIYFVEISSGIKKFAGKLVVK